MKITQQDVEVLIEQIERSHTHKMCGQTFTAFDYMEDRVSSVYWRLKNERDRLQGLKKRAERIADIRKEQDRIEFDRFMRQVEAIATGYRVEVSSPALDLLDQVLNESMMKDEQGGQQ